MSTKIMTTKEMRAAIREHKKNGVKTVRFMEMMVDENEVESILDIRECEIYPGMKYNYSAFYDRCCVDCDGKNVEIYVVEKP